MPTNTVKRSGENRMHLNLNIRRQSRECRREKNFIASAARSIIAALAIAVISASPVLPQMMSQDDHNMPYGSPLSGNQSNTNQTQQQSRPNNGIVDPIAGTADNKIEPVLIAGSDRPTLEARTNDQTENPRVKSPAAPNEFELYVENAIGRKLPRFGTDLLLPSNRDYAVPATATVPPDYILNVGDIISISMAGSTEGSIDKEINTEGQIFLPKVGPVTLAGVHYGDLKERISSAIGTQYRGYSVTVGIRQLRGIRVYVTGFANNPGAYSVNSLSTMVNAVLAAGGPAGGGSFRSIKLYRHGQLVSDFDLYDLIRNGDRSKDAILQNEDVLVVPPVGEEVAITGSVNAEGIYETKPGETIQTILGYAGGPSNLADKSRVMLYRLSDLGKIGGQEVSLAEAGGLKINGGDLLQVLSEGTLQRSVARQSVLVRVEGEVNDPGNYYVPANTSLGEVMAKAGGITSRGYVYGTRVERTSVRRQQREGFREAVQQLEMTLAAAPLTGGQALDAGERASQLAGARAVLDRLREAEPDGRVVLDLSPQATALPSNLILENNDRILIPPRATTVGVFGAVYRPASFLFSEAKPPRVKDYIERAGGPIRAADKGGIFVIRANGSVLSKRNGALSAHVLPGDVIFVPVKTQSTSLWARLAQITTIISQIGFTAAALSVINN
jgi:protein involved in polysaccharide export with SLBB domain